MIDLRSDTVTKPTPEMMEFMMKAPVGDDVFGEDPTINELERESAEMFGFEAGLFAPSGTMTNQIAIKVHTKPGDELICSYESHIYRYEGGGIAVNSATSARLIPGLDGMISAQDVIDNYNDPADVHKPLTSLVSLENTSNRGGGLCYDFNTFREIKNACDDFGLKLHLDGARVFNAIVAKGENPQDYGQVFDSVSICLSKGLGAPVGSVLLGSKEFITKARRVRKVLGGGMRQAGIIAAGGLYAIRNNISRLAIDHENARKIGEAALQNPRCASVENVETNIVMINTSGSAQEWVDELANHGILCMALGPKRMRLVTHLDISDSDIQKVCAVLRGV
ncbi:threonine aldolase family protein [Parvicella tangerina]|uniref:L-allo-threonine aldolase n=1 Tax=Parvicella tangerina TaxID=2829795 RepID=A0A916JIW4_9FLAO|nr:GntG family PLP-dependent aldolase [Parvicella tangerina]CAG5076301.1 L-allo-threonine aldolase [Parvicella tangerina]